VLGFEPRCNFIEGLSELAEWVALQRAEDRVGHAKDELLARGLVA
jgi:dTDP-L-rhamnose 4-epimerase